MLDRLEKDKIDPNKDLNLMMRAHLNRGVYSLISRIRGLSDINEMIKAEQKFD